LAEIRLLAIIKNHQKKGISAKIVEECIKKAKSMGIDKIFALTVKENLKFLRN